ncbi:hypothetical protein GCM10027159_30990 [Lysobacter terrae]
MAGCTRHISRDVASDGRGADELVFPDIDKAYPRQGTRPTLEALRNIGPGIEKDDLYVLVGVPHYREGYWHVREWDYLFNLPKGNGWMKCQYKVLFDKDGLGQSFHWRPADCADLVNQQPAAGAQPQPSQRFNLSGDALFAFGRSGLNDMLPDGRAELEAVAQQLRSASIQSVVVVGHTDLIGDEASNQVLSQRRAQTVRNYLIAQGVSGSIAAEGHGESEPVKACDGALPREALVACLQPNRRVEITGWAEK